MTISTTGARALAEPDAHDLARRILEHARTRPETIACHGKDETTTYSRLSEMADEVSTWLLTTEGVLDRPMAIVAHKDARTVAAVLGCLTTNTPALLLSPALPATTRDDIIQMVSPASLLDTRLRGDEPILLGGAASGAALPVAPEHEIPPGTALLLATSGSTGIPKVVPLASAGIARFLDWSAGEFELAPGRTVLSLAPLNFDLSLLEVWATLAAGATVVLVGPTESVQGQRLRALIQEHDIHLLQGVPMFYSLMLSKPGPDLPQVRHVILTGDAVNPSTLTGVLETFPFARVANVYGATETNDSFVHVVDRAAPRTPMPLGSPIPGTEVLIVDTDSGELVTDEGQGEMLVSTPFQAPCYLDPVLTETRFVDRVGADGRERAYIRSGDLVRRHADGSLVLVGRIDRQVKVRGTAVNLAQVEEALQEHPLVRAVAVVAEPDPVAGSTLVAVVQHGASTPSVVELRQHCAAHLLSAAIPSRFHLTPHALPKTTTGKIDRRRAMHAVMA